MFPRVCSKLPCKRLDTFKGLKAMWYHRLLINNKIPAQKTFGPHKPSSPAPNRTKSYNSPSARAQSSRYLSGSNLSLTHPLSLHLSTLALNSALLASSPTSALLP